MALNSEDYWTLRKLVKYFLCATHDAGDDILEILYTHLVNDVSFRLHFLLPVDNTTEVKC